MRTRPPLWQLVLLALAWLGLTIYFYYPVQTVMDVTLDSSNYASYSYFTAHGFQFGPQVVPMTGPYGFVLYGFVYNADLFWVRTLCEIAQKAVFAGLVLWFMWECRRSAWRCAWFATIIIFSSVLEDFPAEWMMLLGGLLLLRPAERQLPVRWTAGVAILLAFLSLLKGTHFVLAGATMGVLLGHYLWLRDWKRAGWLAGTFAVAFLALWILAGQNPLNIPSFVHGIRQLTDGYNEAMALQEEMNVTSRGLIVLGAIALLIACAAWIHRRERSTLAVLVLFAGFTFANWKHGFVRADGHVYIFFHFGIVAALTVYLHAFRDQRLALPRWAPLAASVLVLIAIGGSLVGAGERNLPRITWLLRQVPLQMQQRARQVFTLRSTKAKFDEELTRRKGTFVMTLTKLAVQDEPIDLIGVKHGIIALNGLNYTPRPMGGGSFNAYNRFLTEGNRDFIRDPERAPKFYLVKLDTIDNRLVTEDDPLSLIALVQHYTPVLLEQGYLLMRRMPAHPVDEPLLVKRTPVRIGEVLDVPPVPPGKILLARLDLPLSALGRLRSAAYKPPLVFMSLLGEGIELPESRRIVPSMVVSPFILAPVIEEEVDILNLFTNRPGKRLDRFGLFTAHPEFFDTDKLAVEFYTLPRPAVPADFDVEELITTARSPMSNVPPESILPANAPALTLRGLPIMKIEPPGEMVWKLEGNEREFLFDYGIDPDAYDKGKGNGVVFIAELRPIEGGAIELHRDYLDPFSRVEDRGNHSARVVLPPVKAGMRLALRTDAGPHGDAAWDWSYFARVQLKRGDFSLKQFPGFNVAPAAADADHAAAAALGKEQVFVLHAPGMLTFKLNGREKKLSFDFGYMPGAYSAGGNTNGGAFVVELARPNQPKETLFRRDLSPVQNQQDQGRQHADIALPALGPIDRLLVRTESGPNDERSWDWTYLANFVLQ
ncbi:MAG: hypothetical protein ABIZ81_05565 [Opitutaceae bacterium]